MHRTLLLLSHGEYINYLLLSLLVLLLLLLLLLVVFLAHDGHFKFFDHIEAVITGLANI